MAHAADFQLELHPVRRRDDLFRDHARQWRGDQAVGHHDHFPVRGTVGILPAGLPLSGARCIVVELSGRVADRVGAGCLFLL